ncbi:E3 ubiquitin-protein ligase TRIM21-like protein [Lates japonicus]|uniref:E3 ubiquitin-protein ligase TRIM21-like protein n=1 Tax=Lates japonicus TaxID=270547 RepID=A0AAD3RI15_LATJO|nr:E3 ubiquitin-protein ligase TRIM21-like protein [Lates japonicus]
MCKEVFTTRPDLKVNTFISEMVAQFRQEAQQKASSSSEQQVANQKFPVTPALEPNQGPSPAWCGLTSYCRDYLSSWL